MDDDYLPDYLTMNGAYQHLGLRLFQLTASLFDRKNVSTHLRTRPQTGIPLAPRHLFGQTQYRRSSSSILDYRCVLTYVIKLLWKDFSWCNEETGLIFLPMVSLQWMLQLLPCGEALPGGTLHHTPRICVWVPSLEPLSQPWLPKWGQGTHRGPPVGSGGPLPKWGIVNFTIV